MKLLSGMRPLFVAALLVPLLLLPLNEGATIYSQTTGQLPTRIQVDDTPADITVIGGVGRVVGTGDFNGDGIQDFLIEYTKIEGDVQEIVFLNFGIIFGKRNQTRKVTINLSTDEPDLSLTTSIKGIFGISTIAKLGDLNGDGIDDLVLTQQLPGTTGSPRPFVFKIFFGSSRFHPGVIDLDSFQPDLKIISDNRAYTTGIAGVGDVNGDRVNDLLLTENGNYISFALPVLLGPFKAGATIDLNSQQPDAIIKANNRIDNINSVLLADVNGDHLTDMLIKKSRFDSRIGIYFTTLDVVFGSPDLRSGVEISLSDGQADATIVAGFAGFGFSVIATGDVNGDGIDDILIGNPTFYGEPGPPPWFSGSVSIVLGFRSMRGTVNQSDALISGLPPPNPFQPLYQTTLGDHLGESLAVRDINGDGVPDILIGAPGLTRDETGRVEYLSRAHVILGSTDIKRGALIQTARCQQDITISFDSKTGGVGSRIDSGDFNGDGVSDILVGSNSAVYVFFGGPLKPPEITTARYRTASSELTIVGTDLTGSARVEVNGVVVDRDVRFEPDSGKLVLRAEPSELSLHDGKNQVAVIRKGARSNTIKLKFR